MSELTVERLRELLHYDPETGVFTNRISRYKARAGQPTGHKAVRRPVLIGIDQKIHRAHRLAFLYMTGSMPEVIDHINGDPHDNRWGNLREATRSQNQWNMKRPNTNTSGFKGVSYDKGIGKYSAYIKRYRKRQFLGYFDRPEEAYEVYCRASKELHGEFAFINRPLTEHSTSSVEHTPRAQSLTGQ